jgi:Mce-associated membrane protein
MADDAGTRDPDASGSTADGTSPEAKRKGPVTDSNAGEKLDAATNGRQAVPAQRLALAAGLIAVVVLAGLVGWLGLRGYESHAADAKRNLFLRVARQCAVNFSTVDYEHADAEVQRILDLATGTFYDNFSRRSKAYVDNVKQAQSKSVGTVTEAGLEPETGDTGQVLVAVTVKTLGPGTSEQEPQAWRMRITVQQVGDGAKVSNVAFVS